MKTHTMKIMNASRAVVQFFKSFQSNLSDMKTLLNFKFGIIKAS
jgi:hypothetical protein